MSKIVIISIVAAATLVGGAFLLKPSNSDATQVLGSISLSDVKKADGKSGGRCLVAVDGTVYEIEQGFKWQDGQHTVSNDQAYCGADLSAMIDKAPHGRTKLAQLKKVGTLTQ